MGKTIIWNRPGPGEGDPSVHPPICASLSAFAAIQMQENLHSPHRLLIELRMEHADLDNLIDLAVEKQPVDELALRRLKKRRLMLKDQISKLEIMLDPKEPA